MQFRMTLQKVVVFASAAVFATFTRAASTRATEPAIPLTELPAACKMAKSEFHPIDGSDVQRAKTELVEAVARLDQRLIFAGPNGSDWRKYLLWDALQAALRGNQPPDTTLLNRINGRYCAGYDGLELVWFLDVQRALQNYIAMLSAEGNPKVRPAFEKIIDRLTECMSAYVAKPNTEDALAIGESIRWLQIVHQCPALVRAIQSRFDRPNVYGKISTEVVAAGLSEGVDDTMPISDCIMGTEVYGTARTVGRTRAELSPDPKFGVIDVLFFGVADCDNVGYHGGMTIFSRSTTDLAARKRIWIDADGLSSFPSVATAETAITIDDIQSRRGRRMIERMAWRRADKQHCLVECIASQHAEQRLNRRIDRQAAEPLERANREYNQKYRQPFTERKLFPQLLRFCTTRRAMELVCLQAGDGKLAAPGKPVPLVDGADASLQIHESAINNLAFDALAGRTMRQEKVEATAIEYLGKLPEKMKGDEDDKPWAITFDRRQPISVSFAEERLTFTLRGAKYYKGPEDYPAMNVSARYKIEKTGREFKFVRQGDIEVFPPGFVPGEGQKLSAREVVIKNLLKKRFEKVFEPEFIAKGFELPGKWKAAGRMLPIQVVCRDGWLAIAWKRSSQ